MPIKNSWIFPVVQSVHLIGIALLAGSIIALDLRVLDLILRRHDLAEIAGRFAPWTKRGLAVMLTTGPVLFSSDVARYVHNPAFLFKMIVLLLALAVHFATHRGKWRGGKAAALASIALWSCVVIGGRAIADFDI